MKKAALLIAAVAALTLSACAIAPPATSAPPLSGASAPAVAPSNPAAAPGVVLTMTPTDACNLWAAALNFGATLKLNAVQEHQVGILETQISPLCKPGTKPPTGVQVQQAIQQALVNLGTIEAVDYAVKHATAAAPPSPTPAK